MVWISAVRYVTYVIQDSRPGDRPLEADALWSPGQSMGPGYEKIYPSHSIERSAAPPDFLAFAGVDFV